MDLNGTCMDADCVRQGSPECNRHKLLDRGVASIPQSHFIYQAIGSDAESSRSQNLEISVVSIHDLSQEYENHKTIGLFDHHGSRCSISSAPGYSSLIRLWSCGDLKFCWTCPTTHSAIHDYVMPQGLY